MFLHKNKCLILCAWLLMGRVRAIYSTVLIVPIAERIKTEFQTSVLSNGEPHLEQEIMIRKHPEDSIEVVHT